MKKLLSVTLLPLCAFSLWTSPANGDVLIIKNRACPELKLSRDDLRGLYLGTPKFVDGNLIKPIDLASGNPARGLFIKKVLGTNEDLLNNQWLIKIFSGKGEPPETAASENEALNIIKDNRFAIGYVESRELDSTFEVMHRIST